MFQVLRRFFVLLTLLGAAPVFAQDHELFEKRIRPLLIERCYECHAEKKQKGGLRLDSAEALRKGGDTGPALVPGKPEESLLIKAVAWSDPDFQMPPKNKLTEPEIASLTEWIRIGAPDPRTNSVATASAVISNKTTHWAYQSVHNVPAPKTKDARWPRNDIDRFILANLESRDLKPAREADRATLLRRAKFDLVGLPPTPNEIDSFLADKSPDAFAKVVDRLMASPQFGERWGRHWLDVVRYGESVTLRGLIFKEAWRYRDYVIDAFNHDLPFDQFLREQISGDLLPSQNLTERRRKMIATTFLALGNTNLEEQDKAQLRMDVVDEQLDTIGKAMLGQTIGCARCHDHKFDPIPTRDYYAMAGILRSTKTLNHANVSAWIEVALPVEPEQEEALKKHEAEVTALQAQIKVLKDAAKTRAAKSSEPDGVMTPSVLPVSQLSGVVVDSAQAKIIGDWKHSTFSKHYIGDGYLHDDNKDKGSKTLTFIPQLKKPGRYDVRLAYIHSPSRATNVAATVFHVDGETTVSVNQQEAPPLEGRFVSLGQFNFEANGFGYVLIATEGTKGHVTADAVQFVSLDEVGTLATQAMDQKPSRASAPDEAAASELKTLEEKVKQLQASGPKRPMLMTVQEETKVEDTRVHIRGNVHSLGDEVPRGFLNAAKVSNLPAIATNESGRRELAEWLTRPENPLTSRVFVNRTWHWLFGAGLVRSTDNFGTMGDSPSHPELLDYLAARFVRDGWSVKKLVRQIMLSRAYQMESQGAKPAAGDPENRLLSRFNRRRLEAEQIRDSILAVSGALKLDAGGPTIQAGTASDYGYQFNDPRRSVYVPALRNALPEIFEVFDFADPSIVTGTRNVSTVAPQALFFVNHPFVSEQALQAAKRLLKESNPDNVARLAQLYRMTLGRGPTAAEKTIAMKHLEKDDDAVRAWASLFHALFASPDFRYLN